MTYELKYKKKLGSKEKPLSMIELQISCMTKINTLCPDATARISPLARKAMDAIQRSVTRKVAIRST